MTLRTHILAMSWLAVVSDAVLIAFYPQFFAQRYGTADPVHAGAYVACISLAVMCTLPLWARVNRHVGTMTLLVWTQLAAGILCIASFWAGSLEVFWLLSMLMFACKSSYLLMFPYLMRLEPPHAHAATVGTLAVLVHAGAIFGAAAGGQVLEHLGPGACLWLMAAGDLLQMAMCLHLLRSGLAPRLADAPPAASAASPAGDGGVLRRVLHLSGVLLVFDFAAYLVRPFFTQHWESLAAWDMPGMSGVVYAIPGVVALAALAWGGHARATGRSPMDSLAPNLLVGAAGLALQAAPSTTAVLVGRVLYGWSLFQATVQLETRLFRISPPHSYASHYGIVNFFQNLGVLLSSFAAGALVERMGMPATFVIAAAGFVLTVWLDRLAGWPSPAPSSSTTLGATHAL